LFAPEALDFWSQDRGLLVGGPGCETATACGPGEIRRTTDGGRSWETVYEGPRPIGAVTVTGSDVAWATVGDCNYGGRSACFAATILVSTDSGSTWREVTPDTPVRSIAVVSDREAWAIGGPWVDYGPDSPLVHSLDGGATWHSVTSPCGRVPVHPPPGSAVTSWALEFADRDHGWILCQGAAELRDLPWNLVLFATGDGGGTWTQHACSGCGGYNPGMALRPDGRGLMWANRSGLLATSDNGTSWSAVAPDLVQDGVTGVSDGAMTSDRSGVLLVGDPNDQSYGLYITDDAGATWTRVQRYPLR
jgi:photosystem II stability/assembly factor-like uncharacterized protein